MTLTDRLLRSAAILVLLLVAMAPAHVGHVEMAQLYGRRPSPAWIRFDESVIGAPDLQALSRRVADRKEWDLTVLMNEVHGHIGPWSIAGCKMGLRALDLLEAGFQTAALVSEGGAVPPRGCITDGMMVCSGATMGRGLARLADPPYRPAATFVAGHRAVRLELRPYVAATIRDTIDAIVAATGSAASPEYRLRLRGFALQVWETWDRDGIFIEEWIPLPED